jgi:hypothetical protein
MPTYIYTAPSGRKIKVTSDTAPTPDQLAVIFKQAGVLDEPAPAEPAAPPARTLTDRAVDALPTVGGALGGIVGGIGGTVAGMGVGGVPGAVGGAALGGAAGEGFRQVANFLRGVPSPTTATDAAKQMGTQAAVQGASELAGQGIVKGAGMAAHGLMDFAIRPAPTVAEEFGDIAATALKERLPVGSVFPGGTKGSSVAKQAMRESAGETKRLLTQAEQAGLRVSPDDLARGPVTQLVGDIAKQPLSESELNQVSRMFSEYLGSHPGRMTPTAVKELKQAAQRIAKPIFRALNSGNIPPAGEAVKAQFNKAIAEGAKESLESLPGVGAKVAESETRTQGLIGASRAIRRAESRRLPLIAEMAAPVAGAVAGGATGGDVESAGKGITAAVVTRALLSPRTTSRAALALTNEQIKQGLRQMPRAAVYQLLDQVTGTGTTPAE